MTPREIKELFYEAAETNDAALALKAAKAFKRQGLWTSTAHWNPTQPNGSEVRLVALRPGCCALCHTEFAAGEKIRWRSRVDCHESCWEKIYGTTVSCSY